MFNRFQKASAYCFNLARTSSSLQQNDFYFQRTKFTSTKVIGLAGAALCLGLTCQQLHDAEAEESNETNFQIPKLLQEREAAKKREYKERQAIDVEKITEGDVTNSQAQELQAADRAFLFENTSLPDKQSAGQRDNEDDEDEDDDDEDDDDETHKIVDPYVKKKALQHKHQEYRTLKVGPIDLLKNGQMVQIAVCDPFNPNKFHPTDKIVVAKHQDQIYAVGAFCGFDYSMLSKGALIGDKLICPTCASAFDIKNGFVDQGPSMRCISSFMTSTREDQISVIIPEHVPAFARRKKLKNAKIDPRRIIVLGDTETALSSVDALRTSFTGEVLLVTTSPFGQFENLDVLRRKFGPLSKNEVYYVEDDYFQKANVKVIQGELKQLDLEKKQIKLVGQNQPIDFEKLLIAWGAEKKRLNKEYSNVFYLEDRHAHSRCHNQILQANQVCVMGGTLEAYQSAAGVRDYLDSIGKNDTQVILINQGSSQVYQNFGTAVSNEIHKLMKNKRISVIMDAQIMKMEGVTKLETIHFRDKANQQPEKVFSKEGIIEMFIKPDVVICENGIGSPKTELNGKFQQKEDGSLSRIGLDRNTGIPSSNLRFSLLHNDIASPIYAAGSCNQYPSFIHKIKVRCDDVKYNIESGFYAAMNMLDKRCEFRYIPMTNLTIGDKAIYFIGERNQPFTEVIISGEVNSGKFVAFYVYGDEIIGFVTFGYQNLHLYLWEAMKRLMFPTATMMRAAGGDFKSIVAGVLQIAPELTATRSQVINTPSVIVAEFTREIDELNKLRSKMNENIKVESDKQKKKMQKIKEKYDREGVNFVDQDQEIGRQKPGFGGIDVNPDLMKYSPNLRRREDVNMGGSAPQETNPLKFMWNSANSLFKEK